jgi:hypothetical protein
LLATLHAVAQRNEWRSHHCVDERASSLFSPNRQAKEELGQSQYLAFEASLLDAAVARPEFRCDKPLQLDTNMINTSSPLPLPLPRTLSAHGEQKAIDHWIPV